MRKLVAIFMVCCMFLAATVFPQNAFADEGKDKKKGLPPGIAKKIETKEGQGKKEEHGEYKGFKITRSQIAVLIAQKDDDFKEFKESKELIAKVNDWSAISKKDRKAVAFVISKGYMGGIYNTLSNGKIVFQPNKPITWNELLLIVRKIDKIDKEAPVQSEVSYEGTVRLIEVLDNNTWVVVKTKSGLQTAYFAASAVPAGLKIGDVIKIKVNKADNKIIESKFNQETVNLLKANQSNVECDIKGFSPYGFNTYAGAILKRTVTEKWQGESSLQVTTNGYSPWQGVNMNYLGGAISNANTFSFYIKGSEGTPLKVVVYDVKNATYPAGGTLEFKASGQWERKTVTFTPTQASDNLALQITLNNSPLQATYYLDGLQLEKGNVVTTWVPGI